jgi:branched-chain amino acid transport system substrate-binding protein
MIPSRVAAFALAAATALMASPGRAEDPFEITAIIPATGPGAFAGKEQARTLSALEGYVNRTGGIRGRQIHFNILDDASSPANAVQLMTQAIASHVAAVVGPGFAGECGATLSLVNKAGPVAYCLSPGIHPEPGSFMFSTSFSTVDLAAVAIKYVREKGYKKIAIISTTDASGQDGEKSVDAALALPVNKELQLVAREHFNPSDLSVAAQLARIKAAQPQVIIGWASAAPFGTILRNVRESGLEQPILTTPANQTYEQMAQYADFLPKDLLIASGPFAAAGQITNRTMRSAVQALYDSEARIGAKPGFPAQTDWDPGLIIVSAYRKLGFDATAEQIRNYIATLRGWIGENGTYDFVAVPQRGLDGSSGVIVRWDPPKGTWSAVSRLGGSPIR